MKKQITSTFLIALIPFLVLDAIAQETEEHVRMEYIFCKLNDGFTFEDVINYAKEYGQKVEADGSKYNQYLMRPMIVGDRLEGYTHVIAGMWPDGKELFKEYGNYVNKYIDEHREDRPHTCSITVATMDRIVVRDFRENETTNERWPVQVSDCNLKDGVSMDYAVKVHRDVEQAVIASGMRGYGIHFQVPYMGFQDPDFDFLSLIWWQSFEHRGTMANNFYKIIESHGQQMNSVASCKNTRSYFVETIFTTWDN